MAGKATPRVSSERDPPRWPEAVYREQPIERYRGNPFLEALPTILDWGAAVDAMERRIAASPAQRAMPPHLRRHEVEAVRDFFQPLEAHIELFERISIVIRSGYVERNPLSPSFIQDAQARLATLEGAADSGLKQAARGRGSRAGHSLTVLGMSGVGKSRAVEAILGTFDQVIVHTGLAGQLSSVMQIVFLKVSCPEDGSIRGLCIEFFMAVDKLLGTTYSRIYVGRAATVDSLRVAMARISYLRGLGLLVIDEVHQLSAAKSGGAERMVNFFKLLSDVMELPVLVIGTPDAAEILGGNFQAARRHSGAPVFGPLPLYAASGPETGRGEPGDGAHPPRPEIDDAFRLFCENLFMAQFLAEPIRAEDDLLVLLHGLTQGIVGVLVKLFMLTQDRALSMKVERLSPELFQSTYDDCFGLLHPHLEALRAGFYPDGRAFGRDLELLNSGVDRHRQTAAQSPPEGAGLLSSKRRRAPAAGRAIADQPGATTCRAANADADSGDDPGVKPRRPKASGSGCLLVRLVEDGTSNSLSPHEALIRAGLIRPLGEEAAAAG